MAIEARIKFFQIERCGYYKYRSAHPSFGSTADLLGDIDNWVSDKTLSETSTYEPSEEQDENLLRTLCYGIQSHSNGDVLLTTWNETPTTEGAVASVSMTGDVNSAAIATATIPDGYLPGYPAYFWFPAGKDFYATIQIHSRLNGRSNLISYFKGFLEKYSQYVVVDENASTAEEDVISGYSPSGDAELIERVNPSYRCASVRLQGDLDYLKANRSLIRKLVRRDVLTYSAKEDVSLWQGIWRSLTGEKTGDLSGEHRVSLDVECQPTKQELNKIISHWSREQDAVGSQNLYQDIGFRLQGESKVRWLSSSVASDVFELDVSYRNDAVVDSESLLSALHKNKKEVLSLTEGIEHEVA